MKYIFFFSPPLPAVDIWRWKETRSRSPLKCGVVGSTTLRTKPCGALPALSEHRYSRGRIPGESFSCHCPLPATHCRSIEMCFQLGSLKWKPAVAGLGSETNHKCVGNEKNPSLRCGDACGWAGTGLGIHGDSCYQTCLIYLLKPVQHPLLLVGQDFFVTTWKSEVSWGNNDSSSQRREGRDARIKHRESWIPLQVRTRVTEPKISSPVPSWIRKIMFKSLISCLELFL